MSRALLRAGSVPREAGAKRLFLSQGGHQDIANTLEAELRGCNLQDLWSVYVLEHPQHLDGARLPHRDRLREPASAVYGVCVCVDRGGQGAGEPPPTASRSLPIDIYR